jgi:hypothetical protein
LRERPDVVRERHEGTKAFVLGSGEPEHWGTCSVDRVSGIRFEVPRTSRRLALRYRTVPPPDGSRYIARCAVDGRNAGEWRLSAADSSGELQIDLPRDRSDVAAQPNRRSFQPTRGRYPRYACTALRSSRR